MQWYAIVIVQEFLLYVHGQHILKEFDEFTLKDYHQYHFVNLLGCTHLVTIKNMGK
jgi:hypothetical protein